jgi:hypothetical protein
MDINKLHCELKIILSGCRHISDAYDICNMYINKYPDYKDFIMNYANGGTYENTMSIKDINNAINDIYNLTYKEDVMDLLDKICERRTIDTIQNRTFLRLGKAKLVKPFDPNPPDHHKKSTNFIHKECPHCKNICVAEENTDYIICGYTDTHKGYDMKGCGRDWCFKCAKILCKSWDKDTLFLEMNRYHNSECCEAHAKAHKLDYENDYCHCINQHVDRKNLIYNKFNIN